MAVTQELFERPAWLDKIRPGNPVDRMTVVDDNDFTPANELTDLEMQNAEEHGFFDVSNQGALIALGIVGLMLWAATS